MRLVLDTNVAISGKLWGGNPGRLFEAAARQTVLLFATNAALDEFRNVLDYPKFATKLRRLSLGPPDVAARYRELIAIVEPVPIPPTILNDLSDDIFLSAALGAKADLLVSGDRHLLDLRQFQGIDIVGPADAVSRVMD